MNAKHTPGKLWRDDDGFLAIGTGDDYMTFADLDCNDADIDEREANKARVIALWNACDGINPEAVPALLAALKKSRILISKIYGKIGDDGHPFLQEIDSALALAKGGESSPSPTS